MRTLRNCGSANMNTGLGKCEPNLEEVLGSILVPHGMKLPAKLTAEVLEEMAHADRPNRIYGISQYFEYAKNGGEAQVSAIGYGAEKLTGYSAWRDTFTMEQYYAGLAAALAKSANTKFDVYHYDNEQLLFGLDDGTEALQGIPCAVVYGEGTQHKTSGSNSTMTVNFSYMNAKRMYTDFAYTQLDFRPEDLTLGLIDVKIEKGEDGFKIFEAVGGNDLTAEYGNLIATAADKVLEGEPAGVSYDSANNVIKATAETLKLKAPSVLYENGIKGIEQV